MHYSDMQMQLPIAFAQLPPDVNAHKVQRGKKRLLDKEEMKKDFFQYNTTFIGLVTGMEGYHLCWKMNRLFETEFSCVHDLPVMEDTPANDTYFPRFLHTQADKKQRQIIFKLKVAGAHLLPGLTKNKKFTRLDYLWIIQDPNCQCDSSDTIFKVKNMPGIEQLQVLEWENIRDHFNLIF